MSTWVNVTLNPGDSPGDDIESVLHIAKTLKCGVVFEFNELVVLVKGDEEVDDVYREILKRRDEATAYPSARRREESIREAFRKTGRAP